MMAAATGVEEPGKKATSGLSGQGKTLSFFQQGNPSQGICFLQKPAACRHKMLFQPPAGPAEAILHRGNEWLVSGFRL